MGIDLGDLKEYGFEKETNTLTFDGYDDFVQKADLFRYNVIKQLLIIFEEKVACHPAY